MLPHIRGDLGIPASSLPWKVGVQVIGGTSILLYIMGEGGGGVDVLNPTGATGGSLLPPPPL